MWSKVHSEALALVFNALNESGLRWMVLRNYQGLPTYNRSKDVDLILSKDDFSEAKQIIQNALNSVFFTKIETKEYQYASCNVYFNLSALCSIKIDLLDGFAWRGAQLFDLGELYKRRVSYKNFFIPDTLDDGFMLWIKPLMTGGFVKEKYIPDIQKSILNKPTDFFNLLNIKFGRSLANEVWPLLQNGRLEETTQYQKQLCRTAWLKSFEAHSLSTTFATIEHFWCEIILRSTRPPASFFAVVGPDGVGKTTFINLLQQELCRILIKDSNGLVIKHFRPSILPNIKKLLSGKNYNESEEFFTKPHRAKPASTFSSLIRISYYWLDYVIGYYLYVRRGCIAGKVYIFDRYFYDFVVDPYRSRINLPSWLRKIFLFFTPQPDIVFFLDCKAETIYSRKQELERNEIDRQLKEYRNLVSTYPKRFVKLDAHEPPHISCETALKALVDRLFDPIQ